MSNIFYRIIWWLSETFNISLGKFAPHVFHQMIGGDKEAIKQEDIIELDDYRPHVVAEMKCSHCDKEWVAVAPSDVEKLQCPKCYKFNNLNRVRNEFI